MADPQEFVPYTHADFLQNIERPLQGALSAIERYFSNAADSKVPLNADEIIKQLGPAIVKAIEPVLVKRGERRLLELLVAVGVCEQEMLVEYDKHNAVSPPTELDVAERAMGNMNFPPIG